MRKAVDTRVNFHKGVYAGKLTSTMSVILDGESAEILDDVLAEDAKMYIHGRFNDGSPSVRGSFDPNKKFGVPVLINPTMRRIDGSYRIRLPINQLDENYLDSYNEFYNMTVDIDIQEW